MDKEAILALFNTIAAQLIAANAPLRFGLVESAAAREQVFRLRYAVVIERGWMSAAQLPDGMEKDAYDEGALQVAAWDGEVLAATTRIVLPAPDRRLPTEAAFDLRFEPAGHVVDFGRTSIAKPYRDARRHRLLQGIIAYSWQQIVQRGFTEICAALSADMITRYQTVGFEVAVVGGGQIYWGAERFPCRFDLVKTAQVLQARYF